MNSYKYIDLFSGAGGLSIGFGNADFELTLANDISENEIETFRENLKITHPETDPANIISGDIRDLYTYLDIPGPESYQLNLLSVQTKNEITKKNKSSDLKNDKFISNLIDSIKDIDVIVGGPPCQGFSVIARSKKGSKSLRSFGFVDDPRNQLFKYFLNFVAKFNPKLVLIENVKGITSASNYSHLIEDSLAHTGKGYKVSSEILNAKNFGIAQSRERIFFIGLRNDLVSKYNIGPAEIFENINKHKSSSVTVREAIEDLPQIHANHKPNNYKQEAEITFDNKMSFGMNISDDSYSNLLNGHRNYRDKINKYKNKIIEPEFLYNHKSRFNNERDLFIYKNLAPGKYLNDPLNKIALSKVKYGVTEDDEGNKKLNNFQDKYFKLDYESVSKTIIAHLEVDGNSYVHPGKNPRSITPREAARIQSFPDWYFFTGTTRKQFKQIGNAVPPILAGIIAKEFRCILDIINTDEK